jgi:hypothetical protein
MKGYIVGWFVVLALTAVGCSSAGGSGDSVDSGELGPECNTGINEAGSCTFANYTSGCSALLPAGSCPKADLVGCCVVSSSGINLGSCYYSNFGDGSIAADMSLCAGFDPGPAVWQTTPP